jgi:tetratricopeptide (TPR) repeat protein
VKFGDNCSITFMTDTLEKARLIADAMVSQKSSAPKYYAAEAAFPEIARQYRERSVKPALPEIARQFKVQAEYAFDQRKLNEAVDRYEDALEHVPWWPEGHFNRALILGELSYYEEAISAMKKYLLLVPDAQDARAAQDKIYQWQSMLK